MDKPKLLWVSDAVAHTGFSTVTHEVLERIKHKYDVHVLGVNYLGDPHNYTYPIYPAQLGGDVFGMGRIGSLVRAINPAIVCIQSDPWLVKDYIDRMQTTASVVAWMPVDGLNINPAYVKPLSRLHAAIGYTQFAIDELQKAGMYTRTEVIPLGIDTKLYRPISKSKARAALSNMPEDWFVVQCVARNQPRKRLDLLLYYFSEWIKDKPDTVKLYYHGDINDSGWDLVQLASFYKLKENQLILTSPNITAARGVPREFMPTIYNAADVHVLTTAGEGFGVPVAESMACKVANLVPEWSGLADWARGGVAYVPCTNQIAHPQRLNTVGGIPDKDAFIKELNNLYYDKDYRNAVAESGFKLVNQPQFQWDTIATKVDTIFKSLI